MKSASLSELKKELQVLEPKELAELCVSLAKYKKENKELLSFLLYNANDKQGYVNEVKQEVDEIFGQIELDTNPYFIKKTLRKILRIIGKYSKYIGEPAYSTELLIYFCKTLRESGIPIHRSAALTNIYLQQLKKINLLIIKLHEDLQYDFLNELEELKKY